LLHATRASWALSSLKSLNHPRSSQARQQKVSECGMAKKKRPRFLTTAEAAEFLRLKKHTLENMRSEEGKGGPPHRKHGGRVFYHYDDLVSWSKNSRRKK
jgi:hypothetical protein